MNVDKKVTTAKRVAGTGQKVHWRCVVPGCNSNSSVNRHSFPKNVLRTEKWVQAINNPNLNGLTCEELSKYKVCKIHFTKSAYNSTPIRQVLKHDAIPELMLNINSSAAFPASTSDGRISTHMKIEDENFTIENGLNEFIHVKVLPSYNDKQVNCCNNSGTPDEGIGYNKTESATEYVDVYIASEPSSSVQNPHSSCADSVLKERNINSTPKTYKRRALLGSITRKSKLTPVARRLHNIVSRLSKKHSKSMHKLNTLKERLESTEKFMRTVQMKELTSLSKAQLAFLQMHVRNVHKKAKARRFTLDDKVLALAILKQSTQCYRLLSRIFILPTPRSLRTFLQKIPLQAGVNKVIFNHLQKQGSNMSTKGKVCTLLWDEVSLQPQIYYSTKGDRIIGFEDWGNARTNKFADHALVFMLRGIHTNWKIPLSYNFCKSSTSAKQLVRCVKQHVRAITISGFNLVATVCDQGQTNVSCINYLLKETKSICQKENRLFSGRIELSGQAINPLFDPPHIIKGMRNNLLTKDIQVIFPHVRKIENNKHFESVKQFLLTPEFVDEINEKSDNVGGTKETYFASWKTIELAYDIDTTTINNIKKQMPKLHDGHIRKHKIRKMKVNLAVQVLSRTVVFICKTFNLYYRFSADYRRHEKHAN